MGINSGCPLEHISWGTVISHCHCTVLPLAELSSENDSKCLSANALVLWGKIITAKMHCRRHWTWESLTLPHILCGRGAPHFHFIDGAVGWVGERQFQTAICPGSYNWYLVDPGPTQEQSKSINSMLDYYVLSLMLGKEKLAQCLPDLAFLWWHELGQLSWDRLIKCGTELGVLSKLALKALQFSATFLACKWSCQRFLEAQKEACKTELVWRQQQLSGTSHVG